MRIEIDQSGKIENTSTYTVIAFSNHLQRSILIAGREKRELQNIFRRSGKPRIFVYKLFAILTFMLIRNNLKAIDQIVIDTEYPGWEHLIKDYLLREIRRINPRFDPHCIIFSQVGKQSGAHHCAYAVHRKKRLPDDTVTAGQVLRYVVR